MPQHINVQAILVARLLSPKVKISLGFIVINLRGGALHELAVIGGSCLSKCVNIFWMVACSVMQAIILTFVFVHASQMLMSILNTRFNLCAQLMLRAWYGLSESFGCPAKRELFLPR